jgi:hypothetical protein
MSNPVTTKLVKQLAGKRATRDDLVKFYHTLIDAGINNNAEMLANIALNFQFYVEQRCINAHHFALQQAARNCRDNAYVNPTTKS